MLEQVSDLTPTAALLSEAESVRVTSVLEYLSDTYSEEETALKRTAQAM
jgi:hypothetical protein